MKLIDCADAVVTELSGRVWSKPFTPYRDWLPRLQLTQTKQLVVVVAPMSAPSERDSRAGFHGTLRVDIGVLKKIDVKDDPDAAKRATFLRNAVDQYAELADQIAEHFRDRDTRVGTDDEFICTEVNHDPIAAAEHLDQWNQFTSIIQLTFEEVG